MNKYYRPIPMQDAARSAAAKSIAGGWCWFDQVERISRDGAHKVIGISDVPTEVIERISVPRKAIARLTFDQPRLMGILNVTPDSFSDGGQFDAPDAALNHAREMLADGADILDIGGESTRPGADTVSVDIEIARTAPVIGAIRTELSAPVSIDTRKAAVAQAAINAGADLINDVAAFTYDPAMLDLAANTGSPVCLMHAQGLPKTMQDNPSYENTLLDVYDFLNQQIALAETAGIPRSRIIVDPGIGFGKTTADCLTLLRNISLFHSLGCVILLGVSRKSFIADISGEQSAKHRVFGSVFVALGAVAQGVQMLRVHDIKATKQALALQMALADMKRGQK